MNLSAKAKKPQEMLKEMLKEPLTLERHPL
jgi:hypothetical protein